LRDRAHDELADRGAVTQPDDEHARVDLLSQVEDRLGGVVALLDPPDLGVEPELVEVAPEPGLLCTVGTPGCREVFVTLLVHHE
jgi:hypothetical protein